MNNRFRFPSAGVCRTLFHTLGGAAALALILFALTAGPALAEDVVYDGIPPPVLQGFPIPGRDALAPSGSDSGKSSSLSGNKVTLNSGTVGYVFGALNTSD